MMKKRIFIAGALFLVLIGAGCSASPVRVEGSAMLPAFANGDRLLIDGKTGEIRRGDVIMFLYPKDRTKSYIKRVVGLPGEAIEIREGRVLIDGKLLEEPYVTEEYNRQKASFPPRRIPEYQYFVMGDNRDNSSDSRYWGTVDEKLVTGKYYMTYSKAAE